MIARAALCFLCSMVMASWCEMKALQVGNLSRGGQRAYGNLTGLLSNSVRRPKTTWSTVGCVKSLSCCPSGSLYCAKTHQDSSEVPDEGLMNCHNVIRTKHEPPCKPQSRNMYSCFELAMSARLCDVYTNGVTLARYIDGVGCLCHMTGVSVLVFVS